MLNFSDYATASIISALLGGFGVKLVETIANRKVKKIDEATAMRMELRQEVWHLRDMVEKNKQEIDVWKEKYYNLIQDYNTLKEKYDTIVQKYDALLEKYNSVVDELHELKNKLGGGV